MNQRCSLRPLSPVSQPRLVSGIFKYCYDPKTPSWTHGRGMRGPDGNGIEYIARCIIITRAQIVPPIEAPRPAKKSDVLALEQRDPPLSTQTNPLRTCPAVHLSSLLCAHSKFPSPLLPSFAPDNSYWTPHLPSPLIRPHLSSLSHMYGSTAYFLPHHFTGELHHPPPIGVLRFILLV